MKSHLLLNSKSRSISILAVFLFISFGCEQNQPPPEEQKGYLTLSQLLQEEEYWEGSSLEYKDTFFTNEEGEFCKTETKVPFTGVIKIRSRKGSISELQSYSTGLMNGDFFQWHDNGRLKSKSQYKDGMRHGYFYIWTNSGIVYSRKFYDNDLEDFSRFEDDGASESGKSLAAIELEKWEGKGEDFYFKFAGDPKREGQLFIRETEELYSGTITALDDEGKKEAILRFSKGKYHGTISKWDEEGNLWEESEFDRGTLVAFTIKNGKPFDPTAIIDLSEDPSMVNLLFTD